MRNSQHEIPRLRAVEDVTNASENSISFTFFKLRRMVTT